MKYSNSNKPLVCMMTNSTCYLQTEKMAVKGVLWHSTGANNPNLKRYVQPSKNDPNYNKLMELLGDNAYNNECVALALGFSAIILFVAGAFTDAKHIKEIVRFGVPYAMGAGVVNGFRNILALVICTFLPIAVSSAMGSGLKIVISFAVSYFLFKETFLKRQILGVGVGAVALVLLNL